VRPAIEERPGPQPAEILEPMPLQSADAADTAYA